MSKTGLAILRLVLGAGLLILLSARAEEGRSTYVEKVRFEGNEQISGDDLREVMRTRERGLFQLTHPDFNPEYLRSDLARLEAFYHRAGFYEVRVWSDSERDLSLRPVGETRNAVDILIHVEEGRRRHLRRRIFLPPLGELGKGLSEHLKLEPGDPFNPRAVDSEGTRIVRFMQSRGYFAAQLSSRVERVEAPSYAATDSVDLIFELRPGPRGFLREIRLDGTSLPEDFLLQEMRVKMGEVLLLEDLLSSEQNLLDTGLFRSALYRIESLGPEGNGREGLRLVWSLRERDRGALEFGAGYGSQDGYRLLGGWTHRNFGYPGGRLSFETLHNLKVDSKGDFGPSFERQVLEYQVRNVIRAGNHLGIDLFREKDYEQLSGLYSLETLAFRITLFRRIGPNMVLRLREQQDVGTQTLLESTGEGDPRYLTRSFATLLERDRRDHYLHPRRGDQVLASYEIAGGWQGGDHHFQKIKVSGRWYDGWRKGVLASRLSLSWVEAFGDSQGGDLTGVPEDGVPYDERFYCGGSHTVRGYENSSLGPRVDPNEPPGEGNAQGGRFMLVGNLEWRRSLAGLMPFRWSQGLGASLFLDAGNSWLSPREIAIDRLLPWDGDTDDNLRLFWGTGFGIHYVTPVTVLRLDLGFPISWVEDRGGAIWHLSLGHSF